MNNVAVIGNHTHSFCSEAQWARAFSALGCQVTPMQIEDVVRDPLAAMAVLRKQDVVTYTRTHAHGRYLDRHWTDRWRTLETSGVRTVGLHLDRFWDLAREQLIHDGDPLFTVGTLWSADGGNDDRWHKIGVNHRWLTPAVDDLALLRGRPLDLLDGKIVFVGSTIGYHQEYPERAELVAHLADTYRSRFFHYGHGGNMRAVREQQLADIYASSCVIVGDACFANSPPHMRTRNYWSDRVPITLGHGGFLVHPWIPGLARWLDTGRHYVTHVPGDWDDLDAQIGAYLCAPGERAAIAEQGRAHVLRTSTWRHRMADVLTDLGIETPVPVEESAA